MILLVTHNKLPSFRVDGRPFTHEFVLVHICPLLRRDKPPRRARVRREASVSYTFAAGPGPKATALTVDAHLRENQPVTREGDRKF